MKTRYVVIQPGSLTLAQGEVDWPEEPSWEQLKELIEKLLEGEPLEHVNVSVRGKRADMFVSEVGHLTMLNRGPLPRNEVATAIYRTAYLEHHPECDPEALSWIAGPAVLFERIVWT